MAITDTGCRQAKAAEKPYKIAAGDGLYLLVKQAGTCNSLLRAVCLYGKSTEN